MRALFDQPAISKLHVVGLYSRLARYSTVANNKNRKGLTNEETSKCACIL